MNTRKKTLCVLVGIGMAIPAFGMTVPETVQAAEEITAEAVSAVDGAARNAWRRAKRRAWSTYWGGGDGEDIMEAFTDTLRRSPSARRNRCVNNVINNLEDIDIDDSNVAINIINDVECDFD